MSSDIDAFVLRLRDASGESLSELILQLDHKVLPPLNVLSEEAKPPLAEALLGKFASEPADSRVSIMWALGKLYHPPLQPFLIATLRAEVEKPTDVLWQTIIALDNIDEQMLDAMEGGGGSHGAAQKNLEIASKYLRKIDQGA